MKRNRLGNIDVAKPVAISQAEVFIAQQGKHAPQAPAGHCEIARVDQRDPPVILWLAVHRQFTGQRTDCNVRGMKPQVGKILFYLLAFVAKADHKVAKAMR
jgi:hypothetical protein